MASYEWKEVKEIFHEALRLETGAREKYLDEACNGNVSLRIEVESLLISLSEAESFLEQPIIEPAQAPVDESLLKNGQIFSHYQIISHVASGGMGQVYLAADQKLHRNVALKVLPEHLLADRERLRRFQREADAVSALNHPNILTIFEFDVENGVPFFASEFVKGETLRGRMNRGRLNTREAVDIAIQTASALQAAHEAGVIHRDIKPENMMIRDDGYVKVLDFGLAKLTRAAADAVDQRSAFFSRPGIIMGTSGYLSPEQARAGLIDSRSDIFSLGVVVYEMLAGTPPFAGESAADVMAAVVQAKPQAARLINSNVSPELDHVVAKMLEKNRGERYQTAKGLKADLMKLYEGAKSEAEMEIMPAFKANEARSVTIRAVKTSPKNSSTIVSGDQAPRDRKIEYVVLGICVLALAAYFLWSSFF